MTRGRAISRGSTPFLAGIVQLGADVVQGFAQSRQMFLDFVIHSIDSRFFWLAGSKTAIHLAAPLTPHQAD